MAFIKSRQLKNGTTYYIVFSQKVHQIDGQVAYKKKWLKVGSSKTEAKAASRQFEKDFKNNSSQFIKKETIQLSYFIKNEFLPWCKTRKTKSEHSRTIFALTLIQNFLGDVQLNEVTTKRIEDYIAWRKARAVKDKKVSNRTINIDLIYLS